jgi:hypothetical protein
MGRLIQKGNSKLGDMAMFNLPATKQVCGRTCPGCYAIREQQRYPTVLPAREARYEASKKDDFADIVRKEIRSMRVQPKHFRIHASGEFYSQGYVDTWESVAKDFPNIIFYAYTKRKKEFNFSTIESLSNVVIIDSFHFKGLNYGPIDKAPLGAFVCPHQKGVEVQCGVDCTYCMTKVAQTNGVYFVKH